MKAATTTHRAHTWQEARAAKADDFINNSLLKDLERSGWFRSLYK
jgi:hypothetical protein